MGILIISAVTGGERNLRQKRVRIAEDELQRGHHSRSETSPPTPPPPAPAQRLRRRNARRWLHADLRPSRSNPNPSSYSFGLPAHDLTVPMNHHDDSNRANPAAAADSSNDNSFLIRHWERRADDIRRRLGDGINFDFTNLSSNEPPISTRHTDNNHNRIPPPQQQQLRQPLGDDSIERLDYETRRRGLVQSRRLRDRLSRRPPQRSLSPRDSSSFVEPSNTPRSNQIRGSGLPEGVQSVNITNPIMRHSFPPHAGSVVDFNEGDHNQDEEDIDQILAIGPRVSSDSPSTLSRVSPPTAIDHVSRRRNSLSDATEQRRTSPNTRTRNRHATVTAIDDEDNVIWTLHH